MSLARKIPLIGATCAIASLCLVVLWSRATRSLWLDETLTAWVVNTSLLEVFSRTFEFHPQSPLYFLLTWLGAKSFPSVELGLRASSMVCAFLSLPVFYVLMKELKLHSLATLATILSVPILFRTEIAFNARPYALGVFLSLLSTYSLTKWLRTYSRKDAFLYVLSFTLTIYAHYLFAPVGLLHLYLVYRIANESEQITPIFRKLFLLWTCCLLLLTPAFVQLLELHARSETYSFIGLPAFSTLIKALLLPYGPLILILWALAMLSSKGRAAILHQSAVFKLSIAWLLLAPLTVFLVSRISGISIFIPRYFLWQVPAFALLAALLIKEMPNRKQYFAAAFSFLYFFGLGDSQSPWLFENWRDAVVAADEESKKESLPVLLYSGLTETSSAKWLRNEDAGGYLVSPASSYGLKKTSVILPYDTQAPELRELIDENLAKLPSKRRLLLLIREMPRKPQAELEETTTSKIYLDYFKTLGYRPYRERDFGDLKLISIAKES